MCYSFIMREDGQFLSLVYDDGRLGLTDSIYDAYAFEILSPVLDKYLDIARKAEPSSKFEVVNLPDKLFITHDGAILITE